jgi:hypothetical protein
MIGVDGSHCSFISFSLTSSCWGVMLPYALNRYCSMVREVTREKPVMWFSMGFRKTGSLMALTICYLIALSKLLDVFYSSNARLWAAFVSSHCGGGGSRSWWERSWVRRVVIWCCRDREVSCWCHDLAQVTMGSSSQRVDARRIGVDLAANCVDVFVVRPTVDGCEVLVFHA